MLYNLETVNTWLYKFLNQDSAQSEDIEHIFFEWLTTLAVSGNYSFSHGLSGGAWLWLFLKKYKLLKDVDEDFYHDLDDQIYRYTKKICYEKNDINGIILLTNYYQTRLNDDSEKSNYRKQALMIAFKLIIGCLFRFIQETSLNDIIKIDIILCLGRMTKNMNFEDKLMETCNDYIPTFLNRLHEEKPISSSQIPSIVLSLKLGIVCNRLNINKLKDQLELSLKKYTVLNNSGYQSYINLLLDAYRGNLTFQYNSEVIKYLRKLDKYQLFEAINLIQMSNLTINNQ